MQNAQKRNACLGEKFWFKKDITTHVSPPEANQCCKGSSKLCEPSMCEEYALMTVNEIINGKVNILFFYRYEKICKLIFRKVNFLD